MSDIKTLKVTDMETFARYNQLKLKAAVTLNRIPTTNELVRALSIVGNTHYEELLHELTGDNNVL